MNRISWSCITWQAEGCWCFFPSKVSYENKFRIGFYFQIAFSWCLWHFISRHGKPSIFYRWVVLGRDGWGSLSWCKLFGSDLYRYHSFRWGWVQRTCGDGFMLEGKGTNGTCFFVFWVWSLVFYLIVCDPMSKTCAISFIVGTFWINLAGPMTTATNFHYGPAWRTGLFPPHQGKLTLFFSMFYPTNGWWFRGCLVSNQRFQSHLCKPLIWNMLKIETHLNDKWSPLKSY